MFGYPSQEIALSVVDEPPESLHRRYGTPAWLCLLLAFSLALYVVAYESAQHFAGVAIDGPFQLYNALRRIQSGYKPGVDFQFFHGLGMPYLHYWLYRLAGGGLRGSELARETITALSYPIILVVFFRVFVREWPRVLCLSAGVLAATFALRLSAVLLAVNGMLGLRAALPTLIPAVLYTFRTRQRRAVAAGLTLGFALFLSSEQGLAALAAYAAMSVLAVWRRRTERGLQAVEAIGTVTIAVLTLVCCLTAIGGVAGMRGALRYNFRTIPMDQYWYFGAPPNLFFPSWGAVLPMAFRARAVGSGLIFGSIALVVYLWRFWKEPEGEAGRRNFALALLPVYGLISCASLLGAFANAYAQPLWRGLLLLGGLEADQLAGRFDRAKGATSWFGVPRLVALFVVGLSVCAMVMFPLIPTALGVSLPHVIADHFFGTAGFSYGGIWPETLRDAQRTVDAHRGPRGEPPIVWSTYAGWIEARNGIFNPSFDYMIHALGPENRRAYFEKFRTSKPQLAQTVLPTYTRYEAWLENNDWPFYDELLRWYVVTSTTPWSIFWERRTAPGPEPQFLGMLSVPAGATSVSFPPIPADPATGATLLEVEIEYAVHNPLHRMPIIGAIPRYLIGIEGAVEDQPVSLDPWVSRTRFPLIVRTGQTPTLRFQTFSLLPGASWTAKTVRLFVRPVDPPNQRWLSSLLVKAKR